MLNKVLVMAFGLALALGGLVILFNGELSLPTRTPTLRFRFSGPSLLFLGLAPIVLGSVCMAISARRLDRASRVARALVGGGIVSLALGFVLAPKS